MRKRRLVYNTASSLFQQIVTIVCGFILPRLILQAYGSKVNGLVSSVNQFLNAISLLDFGIIAVVQSALYVPLAEQDNHRISRIMVASTRFFRIIAGIFGIYVVGLIFFYPKYFNSEFGFVYTASLIGAMCINLMAQFYFGLSNRILLSADQKGYIYSTIQSLLLIASTAGSALLIRQGANIQTVKLVASVIFLVTPTVLFVYVRRHYDLDWKVKYEADAIPDKWSGAAQHVAFLVLQNSDTIVLTIFSNLTNVSIYSVYHMVVSGVSAFVNAISNGIQSLLGELWAKHETDKLKNTFEITEWLIHTCSVFAFGCTSVLILPFVSVYTAGITDANYQTPVFAILITLAYMALCLRLPYHLMILAGGHYRQTQTTYTMSAVINIVFSVAVVFKWGLIGVAVGTLLAMIYQTAAMAWYTSKELVCWPLKRFIKQIGIDASTFVIAYVLTRNMGFLEVHSYISWLFVAVKCAVVWMLVALGINLLFCRGTAELSFRYLVEGRKKKD